VNTWIILRAAGVGSFLMLFGAVAWGLISTTGVVSKRMHRSATIMVHQVLGAAGLVLLVVHVAGLMLDRYVRFDLADVLVPMSSTFRPFAVTLGIVAMYCMVLVLVSSWAKKHLSTPMWRRIHVLSVPAYVMGLTHGMLAGTDTQAPWMWWTYVGSAVVVLFLMVARAATVGLAKQTATARKATTPAHTPAATPAPTPAATIPTAAAAQADVNPEDRVAAARAKAAAMRASRAAAAGHHAPDHPRSEPDEVPALPSQDDRVAAARARAAAMRAAKASANG
jgi:DMSO/TMAO reductase YedYZ heme-binding membrane subunit